MIAAGFVEINVTIGNVIYSTYTVCSTYWNKGKKQTEEYLNK